MTGKQEKYGLHLLQRRIGLSWIAIVCIAPAIAGLWFWLQSGIAVAGEPAAPLAQEVSQGQTIYEQRCAACHGVNGDGQGPGAERLFIKPRDFTRDEYKIKSTAGDEFPTRDDLIRVISKGMPGSSMPAWEGVLTQGEIGAVTDYIQQNFGRFFAQEGYGTTVIEAPSRIEPSAENLARGEELFASDIGCLKCHGEHGRGNGPSAFELTDNAGQVIYPADLTQPWRFRGGSAPEDIYVRLRTGMPGSPMPSFADALSEEETWHLVNYVLSLSPAELPEPAVLLVSQFVEGPLPTEPDDPAWNEVAPAYFPLSSQLQRAARHYQPAVNAVWVKSLYNASEVVFLVEWNDRTETADGEAVDAIAIQFPQELSDGDERPYFVFGDPNRAVYQWYWAADNDGIIERNANGLDAIEDQPEEQWQTQGVASYQDGRWQMVFQRSLDADDGNDLAFETDRFIPISFMAWDGFADEVDGRLGLTTWSVVYLESPAPATRYYKIPLVMVGVVIVEGLIVGLAQRTARKPKRR
ncbi:MAG TPA: c-type cytochrome [Anaerolineae bacterium]|nr:c-type cytochrome [Anaerolineae bacterium]